MTDMVRKVADAIEATPGAVGFSYREWVEIAARAAIEAMREPTSAMENAAKPFRKGVGETAGRIWNAMVVAALADG